MAFTQKIEANQGGFYTGTQIEETPANSQNETFVVDYVLLQEDVPPATEAVIAISNNPLVYQAPPDTDLVTGVTVNGVYTEDITFDPEAGTITINPTSVIYELFCP